METSRTARKSKSFPTYIKIIALVLCFVLAFEQSGFAQVAVQLDISRHLNGLFSSFLNQPSFVPRLRYISYDQSNQSFKIIIDKLTSDKKSAPYELMNIFFTGVSLPNKDFWVNLRPDSPNEIINDSLARTDLGRIMLEADLELKRDLAHATFPSSSEGKEYWDKIYKKIEEVYGCRQINSSVSVNTRIWITPGEAVICEDGNSAYIYKASLNVLTEAAYLSNKRGHNVESEQAQAINDYSSELIQELILPKISKEVNTSDKYAPLRQAYYSLILAQWFKRKFYGAGGLYPYLIDREDLTGLRSREKWSKDKYFEEYRKSFRKKEYDLRVQVFDIFGQSVRTYSSGGVDFAGIFAGNSEQVRVFSTGSFVPPLTKEAKLLSMGNQRAPSLQDPYSGLVISDAAAADTPQASDPVGMIPSAQQSAVITQPQDLASSAINRERTSEADKMSFAARELEQIIEYPQWQELTNEERLSVVSHLFDIYGLRVSWITRDNDWYQLLTRFSLQSESINYTPDSIDFIQQYELARFIKFGNTQEAKSRISKIREVIETMQLKVATLLDAVTTPEGFEFYFVKPQVREEKVNYDRNHYLLPADRQLTAPDSYSAAIGDAISSRAHGADAAEDVPLRRKEEELMIAPAQAPPAEKSPLATVDKVNSVIPPLVIPKSHSVRLQERFDRAEEDYFRAKKIVDEIKAKLADIDFHLAKRRADTQKISRAKEGYLDDNRPAYAKTADRIITQMQDSLSQLQIKRDVQQAFFVAASQELSAAQARLEKIENLIGQKKSVPVPSAPEEQAPATPAPEEQAPATPAPAVQAPATPALEEQQAPVTPTTIAQAPATPAPAVQAPATPAPEEQVLLEGPADYFSPEDEALLIDPKARMKQSYEDWLSDNPKSSTKEKVNKIFSIFEGELFLRIGQAIELGQLDSHFISGLVDFVVQLALETEGSRKHTTEEELLLLRLAAEKKFEALLRDEVALRAKIKGAISDFDLRDLLGNTILAQRDSVRSALEEFLTESDSQYRGKVSELAIIKLKKAWAEYRGSKDQAKALGIQQKEAEEALDGIENAVYDEIVEAASDLKDKTMSKSAPRKEILLSVALVAIFASLAASLTGCATPSQMHGSNLDLAQINSGPGADYIHPDLLLPVNHYLPPGEAHNPNLSPYYKIIAMGESGKAANVHRLLNIADQHHSSSNFKGFSPKALFKMALPVGRGTVPPALSIEATQDIFKFMGNLGTHLLYLYDETDPDIRAAAWWAVGKLKPAVDKEFGSGILKRLIIERGLKGLQDRNPSVRIAAAWALAQYRDSYNLVIGAGNTDVRIEEALLEIINNKDISWLEQYFIVSILATSNDPRVTDSIVNILRQTTNPCVMSIAVEALSRQKAYGGVLPMLQAAGRLQFSVRQGDESLYVVDSYVWDSIAKGLVGFVKGPAGESQRRQHVLVSFIQALQQLQLDSATSNKYELINSNYAPLFQRLVKELNIQKSEVEHILQGMGRHSPGKMVLDSKITRLLLILAESGHKEADAHPLSSYERTEKSYRAEIAACRQNAPGIAKDIASFEAKSDRQALGRVVVYERSSAESRELAADALSRLGNDGHSRRALLAALSLERDLLARAAILRALTADAAGKEFIYTGPEGDFAKALKSAVSAKDWKTIFYLVNNLRLLGDSDALSLLEDISQSNSGDLINRLIQEALNSFKQDTSVKITVVISLLDPGKNESKTILGALEQTRLLMPTADPLLIDAAINAFVEFPENLKEPAVYMALRAKVIECLLQAKEPAVTRLKEMLDDAVGKGRYDAVNKIKDLLQKLQRDNSRAQSNSASEYFLTSGVQFAVGGPRDGTVTDAANDVRTTMGQIFLAMQLDSNQPDDIAVAFNPKEKEPARIKALANIGRSFFHSKDIGITRSVLMLIENEPSPEVIIAAIKAYFEINDGGHELIRLPGKDPFVEAVKIAAGPSKPIGLRQASLQAIGKGASPEAAQALAEAMKTIDDPAMGFVALDAACELATKADERNLTENAIEMFVSIPLNPEAQKKYAKLRGRLIDYLRVSRYANAALANFSGIYENKNNYDALNLLRGIAAELANKKDGSAVTRPVGGAFTFDSAVIFNSSANEKARIEALGRYGKRLSGTGDITATTLLVELLTKEPKTTIRSEAIKAIYAINNNGLSLRYPIGSNPIVNAFSKIAQDKNCAYGLRNQAVAALGKIASPEAVSVISRVLAMDDPVLIYSAIEAAGQQIERGSSEKELAKALIATYYRLGELYPYRERAQSQKAQERNKLSQAIISALSNMNSASVDEMKSFLTQRFNAGIFTYEDSELLYFLGTIDPSASREAQLKISLSAIAGTRNPASVIQRYPPQNNTEIDRNLLTQELSAHVQPLERARQNAEIKVTITDTVSAMQLLFHADPEVRVAAAFYLGQNKDKDTASTIGALQTAFELESESSELTAIAILRAVGQFESPAGMQDLRYPIFLKAAGLAREKPQLGRELAYCLGTSGDQRVVKLIQDLLKAQDSMTQVLAADSAYEITAKLMTADLAVSLLSRAKEDYRFPTERRLGGERYSVSGQAAFDALAKMAKDKRFYPILDAAIKTVSTDVNKYISWYKIHPVEENLLKMYNINLLRDLEAKHGEIQWRNRKEVLFWTIPIIGLLGLGYLIYSWLRNPVLTKGTRKNKRAGDLHSGDSGKASGNPRNPDYQAGVHVDNKTGDSQVQAETGLLKQLEKVMGAYYMTDMQIKATLKALMNYNPGEENYERARQISRHIHPDDFRKLMQLARSEVPFAGNPRLQGRLVAICMERPSELSVGLVRAQAKIHDWEERLKKSYLKEADIGNILGYCENIVKVLPLRLTQETNDSIGTIHRTAIKVHELIRETMNHLFKQEISDKSGYIRDVNRLLARGHSFSDYLGALGYLADLDIAKGYIFSDKESLNNTSNGSGNGNSNHRVRYSSWHKLTAVPNIADNAILNLKSLLPHINTEGSELTLEEYYTFLQPTRIGSSHAWLLRKPVSIFFSFILGISSITVVLSRNPINFANPSFLGLFWPVIGLGSIASCGFFLIPAAHFIFAKIGWRHAKRDLYRYHRSIEVLGRRWDSLSSQSGSSPVTDLIEEDKLIGEDYALQGPSVTREDVRKIAEIADSLGLKPVDTPAELVLCLQTLFGPGRFSIPSITVIPQAQMYTSDYRPIRGPVRTGGRILVGDDDWARYLAQPLDFFAEMAHEQMAERVAENRPDLNTDAHNLVKDMAQVVRLQRSDDKADLSSNRQKAPGGIDFREINFTVKQTPGVFGGPTELKTPDEFSAGNIGAEMDEIQRLINARIIPSSERINDLLGSLRQTKEKGRFMRVNNFLAEIFVLEEEYSMPCDNSFVDILQKIVSIN